MFAHAGAGGGAALSNCLGLRFEIGSGLVKRVECDREIAIFVGGDFEFFERCYRAGEGCAQGLNFVVELGKSHRYGGFVAGRGVGSACKG